MLKKFGETLTEGAMQWYSMLPQQSIPSFELHYIPSFELLVDAFVKAHAGARKVQARKTDIFKIFQRDDEQLREFVTKFHKERMLLPPVPEEWVAQAFTKGLNPQSSNASLKMKENLLKFRAVTLVDVHSRYESKIRVEDDQLGLPPGPLNRMKNTDRSKRPKKSSFRSDKGKSGPSCNTMRSDRQSDRNLGSRAAIGHIKDARWPRPLRTDPSQRDPNLIYDYHGTHGHRTDDCKGLRDEVARLLKNGHLREFLSERAKNNFKNRETNEKIEPDEPRHMINMIKKYPEVR
ncbi:uncharacterized protein LOC132624149 [Lycium barbarum]|uniref:uncharacterized protein LOC132624149 n=1 Tax=Lycium barbarum TaxID=112863 RepID=UPI00293E7ACC|nr:uncharacterized protein LOC132624149 [Lycium barbarum]